MARLGSTITHARRRLTVGGLIVACLAGLSLYWWMSVSNSVSGGVDFNQFYAAARLSGTGELYNWQVLQATELQQQPHKKAVPFGRLPVYAAALRVLTILSHGSASIAWAALNAAAIGAFALLWPFRKRAVAALGMCWSFPAATLLHYGQDTGLFLLFAAVGLRLLIAGRSFLAGLMLSACAIKFHLAAGILVLLLAQRRFVAVLGGLCGGLALFALSFALEGPGWPSKLLTLARLPQFDPAPARMPNLRGLASWLPSAAVIEAILATAVLAALWYVSRRTGPALGMALALAAGLLVSHHAYIYDAILLFPVLMYVCETASPVVLRLWALLLFTPMPYLLMLQDRVALAGQISIAGFPLALLLVRVVIRIRSKGCGDIDAPARLGASPPIPNAVVPSAASPVPHHRYPPPVWIGTALAVFLSSAALVKDSSRRFAEDRAVHDSFGIAFQQRRLQPALAVLPDHGAIGYLSDLQPPADVFAYFVLQYVLAPRVLAAGTNHPWVLGSFERRPDYATLRRDQRLEIAMDCGSGLILFRKVAP